MNRIIFLYGPPGSGKSTLGKLLADALNRSFFDTDAVIEAKASVAIADIFKNRGEAAFRQLECEVLRETIGIILKSGANAVISLGGGTLLNPDNRDLCEKSGVVWCIDTPTEEELCRRLNLAQGTRPLGNKAKERAEHYASFGRRVANFFMLPGSTVVVGTSIAEEIFPVNRTVVDGNVSVCHRELAGDCLAVIPSGEKFKTPETIIGLWRTFAAAGIGRKDVIAACGGGVTGDLTGFAAATWMRGIDWVNFPTTLLSMVDASTGGKTGCDLPEGKNLAGAFHSPRLVIIDTDFLKTLPRCELCSGMAEMIKHEIIGGLPSRLTKGKRPSAAEIAENLSVKINIIRQDPFEKTGKRILLNCGHTVGHAVETASEYTLTHGECVAIGCVEEARFAVRLGLAKPEWPEELAQCFRNVGLPVDLPEGMSFESLIPLMHGDKKRQGRGVVFALPCGRGDVRGVMREFE